MSENYLAVVGSCIRNALSFKLNLNGSKSELHNHLVWIPQGTWRSFALNWKKPSLYGRLISERSEPWIINAWRESICPHALRTEAREPDYFRFTCTCQQSTTFNTMREHQN
jgi:hypothetical protein